MTRQGTTGSVGMRRVVAASAIGNGLEWYDYAAYGLLATTLAKVFFPEELPSAALLSTLAVFGVAFVARPISAFVFGRVADQRGRRPVLVMTVLLMSAATLAIAALPSYDAIGLAAPVLLLVARLLQGVAVGAEWGSAAAFLSECTPAATRGRLTSFLGATAALGPLVASVLIGSIAAWTNDGFLLEWGWRIPFLLGGVIGLIGLGLRLSVPESPVFEHGRDTPAGRAPSGPSRGTLTTRALILAALTAYWAVIYYVVLTYVPTFVQAHGRLDESAALFATSAGLVVLVLAIPVAGRLSDRWPRRRLAIVSGAVSAVVTVPLAMLLPGASFWGVVGGVLLWNVSLAINGAIAPALASGLFPPRVRTTWIATTYAASVAVFGGTTPYISEWLVQVTGDPHAFAWWLVLFSLVGVAAGLLVPRRESGDELAGAGADPPRNREPRKREPRRREPRKREPRRR
ncbi:MFS transporter [Agromyces aerolatus]|nr:MULTISPECIES: MFS transporter [unclassified Agromyces]MDR5700064.1 MFS transporter [Agromyces sp. LY-1074]MDR5706568.1 MFS transporter [Agromyces sp. LY-1358]